MLKKSTRKEFYNGKISLKSRINFKKQILKEIKEIPTMYLFEDIELKGSKYNFLVLELLGPSVEQLLKNTKIFTTTIIITKLYIFKQLFSSRRQR